VLTCYSINHLSDNVKPKSVAPSKLFFFPPFSSSLLLFPFASFCEFSLRFFSLLHHRLKDSIKARVSKESERIVFILNLILPYFLMLASQPKSLAHCQLRSPWVYTCSKRCYQESARLVEKEEEISLLNGRGADSGREGEGAANRIYSRATYYCLIGDLHRFASERQFVDSSKSTSHRIPHYRTHRPADLASTPSANSEPSSTLLLTRERCSTRSTRRRLFETWLLSSNNYKSSNGLSRSRCADRLARSSYSGSGLTQCAIKPANSANRFSMPEPMSKSLETALSRRQPAPVRYRDCVSLSQRSKIITCRRAPNSIRLRRG